MGGGHSSAPSETEEQKQLEALRKRKDKEMQQMLLSRIRNMKGGGATAGTSDSDLG